MKIFWTYILNTDKENKIQPILDDIMLNHVDVYGLSKKLYWKDRSKYYVTFYTEKLPFDLNSLLCHTLAAISHQWEFNISTDHISGISGVTPSPSNHKIFWVGFTIATDE
jgi:hypothetical protein